ncbi:adenine phosphoribosyltransferase [Pristimantis euphronides]
MSAEEQRAVLRGAVREFPDYPLPGVCFRDITPILKDPAAFSAAIDLFESYLRENFPKIDSIAGKGASSRKGHVCVVARSKSLLWGPGPTSYAPADSDFSYFCSLCLLQAEIEIQTDAVHPGQKVVLIDDLLATGGTMAAACELLQRRNADIPACLVIIELTSLKGAEKLEPHPVLALLQYD